MTEGNDSVLDTTSITSFPNPDQSSDNLPTSLPPKTYRYYHAGPLFTLAELHTNTLLSQAIQTHSSGKFIPILPQDLEQRDTHPQSIRDADIRALLSCDLALFTYDGTELDAGTVVEYMFAKFADVPAVILRTDFRGGGDQSQGTGEEGKDEVVMDNWNLMSSFYPRTVGVTVNSMIEYKTALGKAVKSQEDGQGQQARQTRGAGSKAGEAILQVVAHRVVSAFEEVLSKPSRLPKELRQSVYEWLALMPGFRIGDDQALRKEMSDLCERKIEKGLL